MSPRLLRCAAVLRVSALAGLAAVVTASCSRERNAESLNGELPASLPNSAETSLSLKRGMITVAGDKGTFKPCGSDADLWVVDQSDGSYQVVAALVEPDDALYVEARGERGPIPEDQPAAGAYVGAFVMEQILYAGMPAPGRGCEAPAPTYIVQARSNEPPLSWTVEVDERKMQWMLEQGEVISFDSPRELDTEGAVSYEGRSDQHALQLIIDSATCRDPTTEEFFAYSARVLLDGKEFKGCARVGR